MFDMSVKYKVLFYSSVKNIEEFNRQKFYVEDVAVLRSIGLEVMCTNNIKDFITGSYDLAFLYFYKWSVFPALLAKCRGKRIFCTGGIDDLSPIITSNGLKRSIYQMLFLIIYFLANKLNIVSKTDHVNVERVWGVKWLEKRRAKFVFFPHSVELSKFNALKTKAPHSFVTICWMETQGNVIRKGLDKSFLFFAEYVKIHPQASLQVIGKIGDGTSYLKSLNVYPQIKDNVVFLGYVEDNAKFDILNNSMFYLQFSQYEGFGVAALEANISRCYILHSGSGGYLSSEEIWGKRMRFDVDSLHKDDINWIHQFSYEAEARRFEDDFEATYYKFSRRNRAINWNKYILNE